MNKNNRGSVIITTILIIVGVVIITGLGIGIRYYQNKLTKKPNVQISATTTPTTTLAIPTATTTPETQDTSTVQTGIQPLSSKEITVKNCDTNLNCFIEQAQNCSKSKVVFAPTINLFGIEQKTTYLLEIKGLEMNKCNFYLKINNVDLTFSPQLSISEEEKLTAIKTSKITEGRDGLCKFKEIQDLVALLKNWQNGKFDSGETHCNLTPQGNKCVTTGGDFGKAECSGSYFNTSL